MARSSAAPSFSTPTIARSSPGAQPRAAGISGSDIRDMMLEAVEARFGDIRALHPVEWLSDNGSIYTSRETRVFATQLNLVPASRRWGAPRATA